MSVLHYENMPVQYTEIFFSCKKKKFGDLFSIFFLICAQNIDCGYTLGPPRLAKIRKIDIPMHTPVFLYKSGV